MTMISSSCTSTRSAGCSFEEAVKQRPGRSLSKEGVHWPLGPRTPMGASIFICSEDGIADTVRPRCEAAGADLKLVHVLKSTFVKNGKKKISI